jgi:hypothetical protein
VCCRRSSSSYPFYLGERLLAGGYILSNWSSKGGQGTYEECNTDGEGYRGVPVTFDPFFDILCEVTKEDGYMRLVFNGLGNLPDVVSEWLIG